MKNLLFFLFFVFCFLISKGQVGSGVENEGYYSGSPLRIGNQWQLLLNESVIEDRFNLTRQMVEIEKYPRNPILVREKPWEGDIIGPVSVLWDSEYGKYRMWYRAFSSSSYYGAPGPPYYMLYAESDDGLNWEKPLLDVIDMPGFNRTNVIYTGTFNNRVQGPQVFIDEKEKDPDKRYKMVTDEKRLGDDGELHSGVQMAYSVDGFHWSLDEDEESLLDYHSDTYNHVVRSPDDSKWLLYCRPILMDAGNPARHRRPELGENITGPYRRHTGRRVSVAVSDDLKTWTFPRTVLYPDERDAPDIDQCLVFPAGSGLVMLYAAMQGDDTGASVVKLASSSDGFQWYRFFTREPFIPHGAKGSWDDGSVSTSGPPVEQGEYIFMYYNGSRLGQHEFGNRMGGIGVAMTKKNRFVEQFAGDVPGYLLTKEFIFEGDRLVVNTTRSLAPNKPAAELRVEILQKPPALEASSTEIVVPGFSLADCDVLTGDRTEVEVTWNGSGDLSAFQGKPVYLRFQLRNKGLCAFRIVNSGDEYK